MPVIHLTTCIHAPIERCFDLSRSIDLHLLSTTGTNEKAVGGVTKGLIGAGETVTWKARHFGIYQYLTTRITDYEFPFYFRSEMLKGAFTKIDHQHCFEEREGITIMHDVFDFEAPLGIIGKIVAKIVLLPYMTRLLEQRNSVIKEAAESEGWRKLLAR
jgi:ligand-binding SRPBCC domain-containing protein